MNSVLLSSSDNVLTVTAEIPAGSLITYEGGTLRAAQTIPVYHKVAREDIPAGAAVCKYGANIGVATKEISAGSHVHTHNLISRCMSEVSI